MQTGPFQRLLYTAMRAGYVVLALVGLLPLLVDTRDALDPRRAYIDALVRLRERAQSPFDQLVRILAGGECGRHLVEFVDQHDLDAGHRHARGGLGVLDVELTAGKILE